MNFWEIDAAALRSAKALLGQQPRADATIIQLPAGGPALATDLVPIFRNGQTYAVAAGAFPILNGYIGPASAQTQLGFYSVKDVNVFGANSYTATGNGVTDDTIALQGIMANMPAHGVMYFPPGTYKTTGTLFMTIPIYMVGQGRFAVVLSSTATGGPAININGCYGLGISGMRINSQYTQCLAAYGTGAVVGGVIQQGYAKCGDMVFRDLYFTAPAAATDAVLLSCVNAVYFETTNWTSGAGTNGLHITGAGVATGTGPMNTRNLGYSLEIHLTDCVIGGGGVASDTTSCGIKLDGWVDGVYCENLDILGFAHSIALVPATQTATYVDTGGIVNTYTFNGFSGDFYLSNSTPNSASSYNFFVQPQDATSNVNAISVANCQIAGAGGGNPSVSGVFMDTAAHPGSQISGVFFSNTGVAKCSGNGVQIRGCSNVTFTGGYVVSIGQLTPAGTFSAILLDGAASTNINFYGVNCSVPFAYFFPTGYAIGGLNVIGYAHTNINFRDCNFTGTSGVNNGLLAAQKQTGQLQIRNCIGINPGGSGAFTAYFSALGSGVPSYNLSAYDVDLYISGGTAVTISANGAATGLAAGMFSFPPGGILQTTYTGSPTITAFAH